MLHSVKQIAKNYSKISNLRGDNPAFNYDDFLKFASENKGKYRLDSLENGDYLVSTFWSGDLIDDYRKTLK